MAIRFDLPSSSYLDANGNPLSGALLYMYEAGTTTPLDTYSDEALTTANANPVVADSAGKFGDIWLKLQAYKVILKTSAGVTVTTMDPVNGGLVVSGDDFKTSPQDPADMTVSVGAGTLFNLVSKAIVTKAAQTSATITAPSGDPRWDIIHIDRLTGVIGIDAGSESATPADPTISDDKLPLARVKLATTTTEIGDSLITDIRELANIGVGSAAVLNTGALGAAVIVAASAYPAGDGSAITSLSEIPDASKAPPEISNGTDTDHDIDIVAGYSRASDAVALITNGALTIAIDSTGNGGRLDSETLDVDTWYAVLVGRETSGGTIVGGFKKTDAKPAAWDYYRRCAWVQTDGSSNIKPVTQDGDEFLLKTPVRDFNANDPGTSELLSALSVPPGLPAIVTVSLKDTSATSRYALVTSPDQTNTAPSSSLFHMETSNVTTVDAIRDRIRTDSSSRIRTRLNSSAGTVTITGVVDGWIDTRGRDA